ncbi:MAG: GNAT family N-acetyltransferase [Gemmatimonadaceae bacterium]
MAIARSWHHAHEVSGPEPALFEDIEALNHVFSEAFTERYRRDGLVGVRVPPLNPAVWRYAIEDAAGGAMLWRDETGDVAAFNVAHCSGTEGWMGPLAVHPDHQDAGLGKSIVVAGVDWLRQHGARVIGLETMPRTMDNIGFYSALGFVPGRLTVTVTLDSAAGEHRALLLGRLPLGERDVAVEECRALVTAERPGYDFTREIRLTNELALGETVLLRERGRLIGFAVCHTAPLVEGRVREELRVLKLVLGRADRLDSMLAVLRDFARRSGTRRVALRIQGEYENVYSRLIALGARVRWTDLRMTLAGAAEPAAELADEGERRGGGSGLVLSNWEV